MEIVEGVRIRSYPVGVLGPLVVVVVGEKLKEIGDIIGL